MHQSHIYCLVHQTNNDGNSLLSFELVSLISFLFSVGISGAYVPERRADETANQNENASECDPDPKIEWEDTTYTPSHKEVIIEEFKTAISMTEQTRDTSRSPQERLRQGLLLT